MLKISYCIPCMNRCHHLKQTLRENLEVQHDNQVEFILLNYGSQDDLDPWIHSNFAPAMQSGLLKYHHDSSPHYFHMSRAKNLAHRQAAGDIVCNLDADNFLGDGFTEHLREVFERRPDTLFRGTTHEGKEKTGRIALFRHHFEEIGGYNEDFQGWGFEDGEFVNRACSQRHLAYHLCHEERFLHSVAHSDHERFANYPLQYRFADRQTAASRNSARSLHHSREWCKGLLIPRVFHTLWMNEKPLSKLAKEWIAFWLEENPGWRMQVWTLNEITRLPLPLDLPDDLRNEVAKYLILSRYGGCVVDLFHDSYGPLEPRLQNYSSFVYLSQLDTCSLSLAGAFRKHSLFVEAELAVRAKQYDFFRMSLRDRLGRHHCLVLSLFPIPVEMSSQFD